MSNWITAEESSRRKWNHYHPPRGWYCKRGLHLDGTPCALVPRWWNLWGGFWGRTK